jgi:hypothetical protein
LVSLALDVWGGVPLSRSLSLVWRRDARFGPVATWAQGRLGELCQQDLG